MKKRGWERIRKLKFRKIKTWWLLVMLVPLLFVDATLLRVNHIKMTEYRDAVMEADANDASDEEIAEKLTALKDYVFNNIVVNVVDDNGVQRIVFGTGPFYLEHTYIRAANRALDEAEAQLTDDSNPNGNIYGIASEVCRAVAIANGWNWDDANYINCMVGEIQKYPAADDIQDTIAASLPSTELYRHNYASPVWSFSLVGVLILITLAIIVVIFIRGLIWVVLRLSLLFM